MTKYVFFILEIGYCSHMMYRAKYVLVSLHLCTSPFLPPLPSSVGNKWPFCNCILLSWFFTLDLCSIGLHFQISTSFMKVIQRAKALKMYKTTNFCHIFLLVQTVLLLNWCLVQIDEDISHSTFLLQQKESEQRTLCYFE